MNKPLILKNTIQKYAWGSHSAIQQLMDVPPSDDPWAELWVGAHPKAPSQVNIDGQWVFLDNFISRFPEKILGEDTAKKFNNTLPYLFKLLAAGQPLSIQAHPNAVQAHNGFKRESETGLDINAPIRNYKDTRPKPECICALTTFTGLKGFREIPLTLKLLERFCPKRLSREIEMLKKMDLKQFFKSLMELPEPQKDEVILEAVENAKKQFPQDIICQWLIRLYHQYPSDIGVLSPLFLNLFCLEPGQALFLPAGELHAYLDGLGIELMANSDNVLRGGLTPKHVDVPELLNVLAFKESDIEILLPESISDCEGQYPVVAEEFMLSTIHLSDSKTYISPEQRSVEILLCIHGNAQLTYNDNHNESIDLKKGDSVLIPANADVYQLNGDSRLYKASVPL
ncbi:MAG: mannose-6-phosphate isomerase, class I [Desulfobacteraceae bacterium]|nr:mannose-6-phosphate isomerase, class I [Desulfobacteraceae bacterium]MBC2756483.1 mannose-6-phosphate isomerase, class I [Desulfobacteraceae bacterium]